MSINLVVAMASPFGEWQPPPQKSRRAEQACERCQTKKIRCNNGTPTCSTCETQGVLCVYSQARRRGKGKTQDYVRTLEQRIQSLEASLSPTMLEQASSTLPEAPVGHVECPSGMSLSSWIPETEINDRPTVLDKNTTTAPWNSRQTVMARVQGQNNLSAPNIIGLHLVEHDFNALRDTISGWLPDRYNFAPILPISELVRMIEIFLEDFNATFPLFHDHYLMLLCQRKGQERANSVDPAWWACSNAVIAIVTQSRTANSALRKVSEFSWAYFKNAFSVFGEIIAMEPSILGVQALLAMASFLSRSTDLKTAILLTSAAIRTIQIMGLHKEDSNTELSLAEAEQRRRIVWAAFLLDTSLTIRAVQPFALKVTGIQLALPDENSINDSGNFDTPHGVKPTKIFILKIQLAIIYAKAYDLRIHGHFTQDKCMDLWVDLEAWQRSVPITIRPELNLHPEALTQEQSVLLLHLAYYDCVSLMHTITDLSNARSASSTDRPPIYYTYSRAKVARATLGMIDCLDTTIFTDIWIVLPTILSATFSLMSDVYTDPNDEHAIGNVKLIASFVRFLENLQRQGCDILRLSEGCAKLARITRCLILKEQCTLHKAVRAFLSVTPDSTTSYKEFSQGLMTNLPRIETEPYVAVAANIFGPSKQGTGASSPLLAPKHMMPSTFGFGKTSNRTVGKDLGAENAVGANAQQHEDSSGAFVA